jgi:hypothetical protein
LESELRFTIVFLRTAFEACVNHIAMPSIFPQHLHSRFSRPSFFPNKCPAAVLDKDGGASPTAGGDVVDENDAVETDPPDETVFELFFSATAP